MKNKLFLITGAAGFIGYHLCEYLLKLGHKVIGLDNINDYYDVNIKYDRLENLGIERKSAMIFSDLSKSKIHNSNMRFVRMNLEDRNQLPKLFEEFQFDVVCNLAAQAGVRYSIENPEAYVDSNVTGFLNILECCRNHKIKRLVYASSSSVYGNSDEVPFKETLNVDKPISLYAATKKSNELMAYSYSHLYKIETIGLRFFTVYGPWGRPDMAMFLFTDAIFKNKSLKIFNNGNLYRDFTYIDDVVNGMVSVLIDNSKGSSLYKLYNIGNNSPIRLMEFVNLIEKNINLKIKKEMYPIQEGDVNQTWADVSKLKNDYNYMPNTSVDNGIKSFIEWYKKYYKIKNTNHLN